MYFGSVDTLKVIIDSYSVDPYIYFLGGLADRDLLQSRVEPPIKITGDYFDKNSDFPSLHMLNVQAK